MTFKIIREAAALNNAISKVIKVGQSYRDQLHVCVVSALYHAAEHGQTAPLNRLYESLTSNDQTALRGSYIRRIHAAVGGIDWAEWQDENGKAKPVPEELMKASSEKGAFLSYSEKQGFFVKEGTMEARKGFQTLAEKKLINPDPKEGWLRFFERNNLAGVQVFGNKQVLAGAKALKSNSHGESERKKASVHPKLVALVDKFYDEVTRFYETNGDAAEVEETETRSTAQRRRGAVAGEGAALN